MDDLFSSILNKHFPAFLVKTNDVNILFSKWFHDFWIVKEQFVLFCILFIFYPYVYYNLPINIWKYSENATWAEI